MSCCIFLQQIRAHTFNRDYEIPGVAQSFTAPGSYDRSELLASVKFRNKTGSCTVSRGSFSPETPSKKLLVETGNACSEVAVGDC